jgi:hypothetical protein
MNELPANFVNVIMGICVAIIIFLAKKGFERGKPHPETIYSSEYSGIDRRSMDCKITERSGVIIEQTHATMVHLSEAMQELVILNKFYRENQEQVGKQTIALLQAVTDNQKVMILEQRRYAPPS